MAETVLCTLPHGADATVVWHGFAHAVRWTLDEDLLTPADLYGRDECLQGLGIQHPYVRTGDCTMSCPICGSIEDCYLDYEGEDDPVFWVDRMQCTICGFTLDPDERIISQALFATEVGERRAEFLKGYGLPVREPKDVPSVDFN